MAFWIASFAVGLALAGFLFAWSGLYNVAASRGHWAIVEWFLAFGMRNSVELRAARITSPPLDDQDLITLGAAHFHDGCAFCHGAPGLPVSPIAQQMLPAPPDLSTSTGDWNDRELFWIVQHGIKYTGMPGWVAIEREDEIWAVVAFLKRLPALDAAQYRALALGTVHLPIQTGKELATVESDPRGGGACARCHGGSGAGPASDLVPVLHGQRPEFLARALQEYAAGSRPSGIMQPLAAVLDAQASQRLAEFYAGLPLPAKNSAKGGSLPDSSLIELGKALATDGDLPNSIPACNACHGAEALPIYPRLAGQNEAYMINQLNLWKAGRRGATDGGAIMAPIARRLSDRQIAAAAAYFGNLQGETTAAGRP